MISCADGRDPRGHDHHAGMTLWLTGLPSSAKSTIAAGVAEALCGAGRRTEILDGDEIRRELSPDLGFTQADRNENVRRIGYVAQLLAGHGIVVLVPVIAPYAEARWAVRARHRARGTAFAEVYVATPLSVYALRDVKGLYALQRAGRLSGLTGVDDPYEAPQHPDFVVETQSQTVAQSVAIVVGFVAERTSRALGRSPGITAT